MSRVPPMGHGDVRVVTLRIDSRLDLVGLATRAVRALCATSGLPARECAHVELAVDEALNNVIRHAYRGRAGHPVDITFTLERERFTIEIADEGEPMPERGPAALEFDPLDVRNLPEGGMGLHIIHSVMDQVEFRRFGGRNALTMSRRLAA